MPTAKIRLAPEPVLKKALELIGAERGRTAQSGPGNGFHHGAVMEKIHHAARYFVKQAQTRIQQEYQATGLRVSFDADQLWAESAACAVQQLKKTLSLRLRARLSWSFLAGLWLVRLRDAEEAVRLYVERADSEDIIELFKETLVRLAPRRGAAAEPAAIRYLTAAD